MKNLLTLFLTVLMAVASVRAEEPVVITPLAVGDNDVEITNPTTGNAWFYDKENPSHYTLFSFTAMGDGKVTIKPVGNLDTYGVFYDKDWNLLKESDDWDFGIVRELFEVDAKVGDVYYVGVRGYNYNVIGSYILNVDAQCGVGLHTMNHVDEIPATCAAVGTKEHYECSSCHRNFSDAEGADEILDVTIPALGHQIADGQCTREGCDYIVEFLPIYDGDNNVVIDNPTLGSAWENNRTDFWQYVPFVYTAPYTGRVAISTVGNSDTYGVLFDKDKKLIDYSDDEGDGNNFKFEFDAKAGNVYYVCARGHRDTEVGSYIIHVDGPAAPCEVGHHTMGEYVEGAPATCTADGVMGYYECSTCHHKYSDVQGEDEIDDLIIPALGHHLVDGQCIHEGCGVAISAIPLTAGVNSVFIENPTEGHLWDNDRETYAHYTLFSFTAEADGKVTVYPDGTRDTYGALFDQNLNCLGTNDDWDSNKEKGIIIYVKAGDLYYIGARGYSDTQIGNYSINVDEKNTIEAAIGDIMYYELADAIKEAEDGETVTLLNDIDSPHGLNNEFYTYGTITLDLNGRTLYGSIINHGQLTIEDSSEDKAGRIETDPYYRLLSNDEADNSITINGGTFVGGIIITSSGTFYVNGGTFMLPDEIYYGFTMSEFVNIVFGEGVVYRDLSGEHEDISEVIYDVTYSGTFVYVGTPTAISPVQSTESLKTLKTLENGRVVIIRGDKKYDISGREL